MPMYNKKPKSMCDGADCSNPDCYSHGGKIKGVHEETHASKYGNKGESYAGHLVRESKEAEAMNNNNENERAVSEPLEKAKHEHKHALKELKSMKKPNLYAEGGEVEEVEALEDPMQPNDMDNELQDAMGSEFLDALERKDRKGILNSIEAIVLSMKDKE